MAPNVTNTVFGAVDQLTTQLGPLSALVDFVVERIAPHATAKACVASAPGCAACQCTTTICGDKCCGTAPGATRDKLNYLRCTVNIGSFPCSGFCYSCECGNCRQGFQGPLC